MYILELPEDILDMISKKLDQPKFFLKFRGFNCPGCYPWEFQDESGRLILESKCPLRQTHRYSRPDIDQWNLKQEYVTEEDPIKKLDIAIRNNLPRYINDRNIVGKHVVTWNDQFRLPELIVVKKALEMTNVRFTVSIGQIVREKNLSVLDSLFRELDTRKDIEIIHLFCNYILDKYPHVKCQHILDKWMEHLSRKRKREE